MKNKEKRKQGNSTWKNRERGETRREHWKKYYERQDYRRQNHVDGVKGQNKGFSLEWSKMYLTKKKRKDGRKGKIILGRKVREKKYRAKWTKGKLLKKLNDIEIMRQEEIAEIKNNYK